MPADDDVIDNASTTPYVVEHTILVGIQFLQGVAGGHVGVTHKNQTPLCDDDVKQTIDRVHDCGAAKHQYENQLPLRQDFKHSLRWKKVGDHKDDRKDQPRDQKE